MLHQLVALFQALVVADLLEDLGSLREHAFALSGRCQQLRRKMPTGHVESCSVLPFTGEDQSVICKWE